MVLLGFDFKIVCGAAARLPIPQLPKAVKHFEARVFFICYANDTFQTIPKLLMYADEREFCEFDCKKMYDY